jgi:ABC-2 type transport system ATP-binding protein
MTSAPAGPPPEPPAAPLPPPPVSASPAQRRPDRSGDIIVARGVSKHFGDQVALHDIDLDVPNGVIVGLIGPSGCGKTTLVRTLTGITAPTSGEVRVFGTDPTKFSTRQRTRFGYMPQLPVLFPNLTLWGNLGFISSVYGLPFRRRRQRLMQVLELVDLVDHRTKRLIDCSGGMQRRLSLAATLVHDPELLYLDEPTAGVDPILRERFWEHFRALRDQGRTIVVPTQYVGEAVSCDVVAVMATGRIITVLPPAELVPFAYGGEVLAVTFSGGWLSKSAVEQLRRQPFVRSVQHTPDGLHVAVDDRNSAMEPLRQALVAADMPADDIQPYDPTFDEVFVRIIEAHSSADDRAAA